MHCQKCRQYCNIFVNIHQLIRALRIGHLRSNRISNRIWRYDSNRISNQISRIYRLTLGTSESAIRVRIEYESNQKRRAEL